MSIPYEIPLTPVAQTFRIQLGTDYYRLTFGWNTAPTGGWVVDIADDSDDPIIGGIPLVTGSDLLAQYGYLRIPGQLIVETDYDLDAVPLFNNLGTTAHLFFLADGT